MVMQRHTHELMLEHVRAIYHALTGGDLPSVELHVPLPPGPQAHDVVTTRFAELETMVRGTPGLATTVAPFAFVPPIDVIEREKELMIEVALPGVARDDVEVETQGNVLVVSGVRRGETANGVVFRHTEIPRGPFRRVIQLPPHVANEPIKVTMTNGVAYIRLNRAGGSMARA
jgi:HSP20 family protein